MSRILLVGGALFSLPLVSTAQTSGSVQGLSAGLLLLINNYLIPFLISLAVLFFIYNIVRYFILQSHDVEGRTAARQLALWGIIGLTFIMAFWGIIYFVIQGFGIETEPDCYVVPDFISETGYICTTGSPGTAAPTPEGPGVSPGADSTSEPIGTGTGSDSDTGTGTGSAPALPEPGSDDSDPFPGSDDPVPSQLERDIQDSVLEFFDERLGNLFGTSNESAIIDSGIFADLHQPGGESQFNDLERLQGLYRLNQLGAVDTETLDNYLDAVNDERTASGLDPISASEVANSIAIPTDQQPSFVGEERSAITTEIREGLSDHNQRAQTGVEFNELYAESVTDPTEPYAIRRQRMELLLGDNDDGIIYLQSGEFTDAGPDEELEHRLYNYLNTERLYDGNFDEFF